MKMEEGERLVGIKELVDSGLQEVPPIYIRPIHDRPILPPSSTLNPLPATDHHRIIVHNNNNNNNTIPVIDLTHLVFHDDTTTTTNVVHRSHVLQQIASACRDWGFFQVVNHGVSPSIIQNLRAAALQFFELPTEERMKFHHQDFHAPVCYSTSFNPKYETVREWRDTLGFNRFPGYCDGFQEAPSICKEQVLAYIGAVEGLAKLLYKAIFESLGLDDVYIEKFVPKFARVIMGINYYPPCPNPSLTLGLSGHSDVSCLTILHPSEVAGLQIKHDGDWVSVIPANENAFVINLADQTEILTNGQYKSIEHRVHTNSTQPRMSIACFFGPTEDTIISPLDMFIDENNPPRFKATKFGDYVQNFSTNRLLNNRGTLDFARI